MPSLSIDLEEPCTCCCVADYGGRTQAKYHEFKPQEAGEYTLAVFGSGFTPESVVTIDGEVVSDNRVAFVSSHELRVYVRDEAAGKAVVRLAVDGARVPFGGKS